MTLQVFVHNLPDTIRGAYLENPDLPLTQPALWGALCQAAGIPINAKIVTRVETPEEVAEPVAAVIDDRAHWEGVSATTPQFNLADGVLLDNEVQPAPVAQVEVEVVQEPVKVEVAVEVAPEVPSVGEAALADEAVTSDAKPMDWHDAYRAVPRPQWTFTKKVPPMPVKEGASASFTVPSLPNGVVIGMHQLIEATVRSGKEVDKDSFKAGRDLLEDDIFYPAPRHTFGTLYQMNHPGYNWTNAVSDGETSSVMRASFRTPDAKSAVTAASVSAVFKARRGRGRHISIPLFHSGFWIMMEPPRDPEIFEFYMAMTEELSELGDTTYGMGLRACEYRINEVVMDLVLNHIVSTTTTLAGHNEIRKHIHTFDIPSIIAHMAAAIFPNGFEYSRRCSTDPARCAKVITNTINPVDLIVYNDTRITPEMRRYMSKVRTAGSTTTPVELAEYRKLVEAGQVENKVKLGDDIVLHLQEPTVENYFVTAREWMLNIRERVLASLVDKEDRQARIKRTLQTLRVEESYNYISWIKAVEFLNDDDEPVIHNDPEVVSSVIRENVGDLEVALTLLEATDRFRTHNMLSMVGLDPHRCPHCGGSQRHTPAEGKEVNPEYVDFIPLDPGAVFFTLAYQRQLLSQSLEV